MNTVITFDPIFQKHDFVGHPENAKRLDSIISRLKETGLYEKLSAITSRAADIKEISLCHSEDYVKYVKTFCENGGGYLDPDTYSNKNSFGAAATAVAAAPKEFLFE